jgi:hypothetical protein
LALPCDDAERGLEIGILEDAEVLPRAHHGEEAIDGPALGLDDLVLEGARPASASLRSAPARAA